MEEHDKFCKNTWFSKRECNCNLIEEVRADERKKAIYRVLEANTEVKESEVDGSLRIFVIIEDVISRIRNY